MDYWAIAIEDRLAEAAGGETTGASRLGAARLGSVTYLGLPPHRAVGVRGATARAVRLNKSCIC
jgi:hypothetical protein